ncbi:MAG: ABC transporter substrate-binding protein [Bacteroidales bacterium]|nr:ABC transporter substrate-binding protein [Bacteroidales bacterium]
MSTKKQFTFPKTLLFKAFALILWSFVLVSCKNQSVEENESQEQTFTVENENGLKQVTLLPYWVANAQFAGYYMAVEKGFYQKYSIQLQIIPYQPFITPNDLIKDGTVDFAVLWLVNAIELRASGTEIVNIAQPSTRSSLMLITKKSSEINTLEQMNGKKAGIWSGFDLQPKALFNKYHLDVKIIPIGSSNNLFLMDGVDITIANWFDEYHSLLNNGLDSTEINTFFFADYGLNFLEDGIYCSAEKLAGDPELCADFVRATFEGWTYAFDHPDESIDLVVEHAQQANLPVNRVHQKWMLDRYRDLYLKKDKPFNTSLSSQDYQSIGRIMKESGLIRQIPPFEEFYKPVLTD